MSLSNKILIGFFGFIFIYLTATFAEIRFRGTPNGMDDENSKAETLDISGVAYLIVNDLHENINVIGSDKPRLEVRSLSGDWLKKLTYAVSGDTLTLSNLQADDARRIKISVFVSPSMLKGITVNSSVAIVEELQQERLHISQNAGRIWMSGNKIAKIQVDVSNQSFLDISATTLDTLSVNMEGSEVHVNSPVGLLQGSVKNSAFLRLSEIQEIQVKKDETSRLNLY